MNMLSVKEAAERLGMSRQAFHKKILPLLAERGEARRFGDWHWVIDGKDFWMWEVYAATRRNLIEAGEWSARRPWSIQDMEDIATGDMYEEYGPPTEWGGP